jgi:hypothetical protein
VRLYVTKRVSKRVGAPVEGKILQQVFAFDKEVVPAGSVVTGKVSQVEPVRKRAAVPGNCQRRFHAASQRPGGVRELDASRRTHDSPSDCSGHGAEFHLYGAIVEQEEEPKTAGGDGLSESPRYMGMAFGNDGLAWSVYSAVIATGGEVQFDRNAMMDIRFGAADAGAGNFERRQRE